LFYNTGISTYFWIVTNRKADHRKGKIALLDARDHWTKMRKSLGAKRKEITDDQIAEVTRLYHDAVHLNGRDERVKVFANSDFGYQHIAVERPMRRRWYVTDETISTIAASKQFMVVANPPKGVADPAAAVHEGERTQQRLVDMLHRLRGAPEDLESAFEKHLGHALGQAGLTIAAPLRKAILNAAAQPDGDAPVVINRKGQPLPDPDLRDNENVPLGESIETYIDREVRPHVPDAWVDDTKTKMGYEIPFTRYFYHYTPPRPVSEIDAEMDVVEAEIQQLLRGVIR
jgi:type I restriction enzyme M protein